jgi:uncharacterized damage-inducible protein DinB
MLQSITEFADYFGGIRRRTMNYVRTIPEDQLDWAPDEGEYTCRDIVRHMMATEHMYIQLLRDGEWRYPGHTEAEPTTLPALIAQMDASHQTASATLRLFPDTILHEKRPSFLADAPPVTGWRWLMAMVEHEVHHRSQLATYLHLLNVHPPQIFGVTVEELIARVVE